MTGESVFIQNRQTCNKCLAASCYLAPLAGLLLRFALLFRRGVGAIGCVGGLAGAVQGQVGRVGVQVAVDGHGRRQLAAQSLAYIAVTVVVPVVVLVVLLFAAATQSKMTPPSLTVVLTG